MDSSLNILDASLRGIRRIERQPVCDERGVFQRLYCSDELQELFPNGMAQINRSITNKRGVLRGLHFQYPPHAESKYISCLRGEVFDVAVDIRRNSPTFLHYHVEILSEENPVSLFIAEGFAHGFQALSDNCEMLYIHSTPYKSDAEGGLNALDPLLGIDWPLKVTDRSDRDYNLVMLDENFDGIDLR